MSISGRRRAPFKQILPQVSAFPALTTHGNAVTDILATTRPNHVDIYGLTWWDQPTLKCYSNQITYFAGNSIINLSASLLDKVPYPPPAILNTTAYNKVQWIQTAGTNDMRTVLPDGNPSVTAIKVLDNPTTPGTYWGVKTMNLGSWEKDYQSPGAGQFGFNRSVCVVISCGANDGATDNTIDNTAAPTTLASTATYDNTGLAGDVRVMVGNLWSVKIHGNGSSPTFEKKIGGSTSSGLQWEVMNTFTDATPGTLGSASAWYITFCAIGGRLVIGVGSKDVESSGFVYTEQDAKGSLKAMSIPPAPVVVTGISGGGPVYIGLSLIQWSALGGFSNTMTLQESCYWNGSAAVNIMGSSSFGTYNGTPIYDMADGSVVKPAFYYLPGTPGETLGGLSPAGGASIPAITTGMTAPLNLFYLATMTPTNDLREPSLLKVCYYYTPATDGYSSVGGSNGNLFTGTGTPSTSYPPDALPAVDYGPALLEWEESGPMPDFFGAAGSRGSAAHVSLTFDRYALDQIDEQYNATNEPDVPQNWRSSQGGIGRYAPVTYLLGNYYGTGSDGSDDTLVVPTDNNGQAFARLAGYIDMPAVESTGYNKTTYKCTLVDPMIRLKEPAGFIDDTWLPLDIAIQGGGGFGDGFVYGFQGIQYILSKAISPYVASLLAVYMPQDWHNLGIDLSLAATGQLPGDDLPLWNPPYGKYAAEWIPIIGACDFASLFWFGGIPMYGQYDVVVKAMEAGNFIYTVWTDPYDSNNPEFIMNMSNPPTDEQLQFLGTASRFTFDTLHDFNDWVVWGTVPGGVSGGDNTIALGAPLVSARATNFTTGSASVNATWQRTKYFTGAQFNTNELAARMVGSFIQSSEDITGSTNPYNTIAVGLQLDFPYPLHEVFWGAKVIVNAPSQPDLMNVNEDGVATSPKNWRVIDVQHHGTGAPNQCRCTLRLVEIIAPAT